MEDQELLTVRKLLYAGDSVGVNRNYLHPEPPKLVSLASKISDDASEAREMKGSGEGRQGGGSGKKYFRSSVG